MAGHVSHQIRSIRHEIPQNVKLIAITKQVTVELMREAYTAGIRDFGENRLQEALSKQEQLQDLADLTWHFIGHIQKNKAKKVLEHFDWIHSVDSLALATRLNRLAGELNLMPKIFLQVKILPDPDKYGWTVDRLWQELPELDRYQHLDIKGLMTILPLGLSPDEVLKAFQAVRDLADAIAQKKYSNLSVKELSMGMSGDYKWAIQAGATQIRLGRVIFGERSKQK